MTGTERPGIGVVAAGLLFALPAALFALRLPSLPTSHAIGMVLSFGETTNAMHQHIERLLVVPIGALVVVVFRQVLGVRSFGVFSPILIAWALGSVGPLVAFGFLAAMMTVIVIAVRPALRDLRLPYASRVAVLASIVVAAMLVPVLVHRVLPMGWLYDVSYFPVIAACLVSERFAGTLAKEGTRPTVVRSVVTVTQAVVIALLAGPLGGVAALYRFPELIAVVIGSTAWIGARSRLGLLRRFDPRPPPKSQSGNKRSGNRPPRPPRSARPAPWPAPTLTNQEALS